MVEPGCPQKDLLGVLHRSDVIHAYDIALTRRAALRHQAHQVRLDRGHPGRALNVVEVEVQEGCNCAGQAMKNIKMATENCVIASLRRGRQVLIPRGSTILKAGDILVVIAGEKEQAQGKSLCSTQQ